MIMDMLTRRATTSAELITVTSVYSATTGQNTDTESIRNIGKCVFYEGGVSKGFATDAMRERVQAVALFKPNTIIDGHRMRINGKKSYSIIGQEDIANQGRVLVVYLGEIA